PVNRTKNIVKMPKIKFVSPQTRVKEYPEHFHVDNNLLFSKGEQNPAQVFQRTLQTTLNAADSRQAIIKNLVETVVMANIPLEKVNNLRPFLQKYCREGGSIPQAPTLRQVYLPGIFENHM
ncbi:24514_t:CDS:2, partial [Gigaspora rosea]